MISEVPATAVLFQGASDLCKAHLQTFLQQIQKSQEDKDKKEAALLGCVVFSLP